MTHFSQVFNNKVKPMGAIVASSLADVEQILLIKSKFNLRPFLLNNNTVFTGSVPCKYRHRATGTYGVPRDTFPVLHPLVMILSNRPDGWVFQMLISLFLQSFGMRLTWFMGHIRHNLQRMINVVVFSEIPEFMCIFWVLSYYIKHKFHV